MPVLSMFARIAVSGMAGFLDRYPLVEASGLRGPELSFR